VIEASRVDRENAPSPAEDLGRALSPLLEATTHAEVPHPLRNGRIRIVVSHLETGGSERGALVTGSCRPDFPAEIETVFLNAVVNQAATIWAPQRSRGGRTPSPGGGLGGERPPAAIAGR
jgi:hypothetical protein